MFSSQIRLFENTNTKAVSRGWEERACDRERLSKELSGGQTGQVGSPQDCVCPEDPREGKGKRLGRETGAPSTLLRVHLPVLKHHLLLHRHV